VRAVWYREGGSSGLEMGSASVGELAKHRWNRKYKGPRVVLVFDAFVL
jgi:hypothetical protein